MLKPNDPSPCCGNKERPHLGGQLVRVNPNTHEATWNPARETGKLYCSACHREFNVEPEPK